MRDQEVYNYDIVLVWAGIMSATLSALLHELDPNLKIGIFEQLDDVALESSDARNNAGTWHSAFCELNYTPQKPDWSIDVSKALDIVEQFEVSKQFWATLIQRWYIQDPKSFINQIPHCTLVTGKKNIKYLKNRYQTLTKHHLFEDMQYSEDHDTIQKWIPLITQWKNHDDSIAVTKMDIGTDVNFWSLSRQIIGHLSKEDTVTLHLSHQVTDIRKDRTDKDDWIVSISDKKTWKDKIIKTRFVFVWAGWWSLPLLQWSKIRQRKNYGWFPVSWMRLICNNDEIIEKHHTKVYGRAEMDATPMSVPHLDTRIIDWKKALLFGPYAWFTTKFLRNGSFLDLFRSIKRYNIIPMIKSSKLNISLIKYLIKEVTQTKRDRIKSLQRFVPDAKSKDRHIQEAWYRVQIIKTGKEEWGRLQFGTKMIFSEDKKMATLLWASPWASTSASIMIDLIEKCFPEYTIDKLKEIIPSYDTRLSDSVEKTKEVRSRSHRVLWIK